MKIIGLYKTISTKEIGYVILKSPMQKMWDPESLSGKFYQTFKKEKIIPTLYKLILWVQVILGSQDCPNIKIKDFTGKENYSSMIHLKWVYLLAFQLYQIKMVQKSKIVC
jgi:hypothetical protein